MRENIFAGGGVGVEIVGRGPHPGDVCGTVRAEKRLVDGLVRQTPFPSRMCRAQVGGAAHDARRPLRMTGDRIFSATRIVKNDHLGCRTRWR